MTVLAAPFQIQAPTDSPAWSSPCIIDYLTFVITPKRIAELKSLAKIFQQSDRFEHVHDAYNWLLHRESGNSDAKEDLFVTDTSDLLAFDCEPDRATCDPAELKQFRERLRISSRKTTEYGVINNLLEGELNHFMTLLNSIVATDADRIDADVAAWDYTLNSAGKHCYEHSANLRRHGKNSGLVCWGVQNFGVMISFTGRGCAGIDMQRLHDLLVQLPNVKLTRLDIAYDDKEGVRPLDSFVELASKKGFSLSNTHPSVGWIKSGRLVAVEGQQDLDFDYHGGRTFYIGRRANGKQLCIYEKGKQLESQEFPFWVRVELRLGCRDRIIPFDAMVRPHVYIAGSYPALDFICSERVAVPIVIEVIDAKFDRLIKYCKLSYQNLWNYMRNELNMCDKSIVDIMVHGAGDNIPAGILNEFILPPGTLYPINTS